MNIKKYLLAGLLSSSALLLCGSLGAQEAAAEAVQSFDEGYSAFMGSSDAAFFTISNLWLLISAALVFLMHLGFATVESDLDKLKILLTYYLKMYLS